MKNIFNLNIYKESRRGEEPPQAFQPPVYRDPPYSLSRNPNSGRSSKITTPLGQATPWGGPDGSSHLFRRRFTLEGPSGLSQYDNGVDETSFSPSSYFPSDYDPDKLFGNDIPGDKNQYGDTGLATDQGMALHDKSTTYFNDDAALGIKRTVHRKMKGLDRKTPFADIRGKYESPMDKLVRFQGRHS